MIIQPINNNCKPLQNTSFKSIIQPTPTLRKVFETTISNLKYNENYNRLEGKVLAQNLKAILNDGRLRFLEFEEDSKGQALLQINSRTANEGLSNWEYKLGKNKIEQTFHGEGTKEQIANLAKSTGVKHPYVERDDFRYKQIDKDEIPWIKEEVDELHKINPESDTNFLLQLETIYNKIAFKLKEKIINDLEQLKTEIFTR